MNAIKKFTQPIILPSSSIVEEKIFDFYRRTVFSPEISGNCNIKCCTVTGDSGAKSESHTHPGDEIVFTVAGENINSAVEKEYPLRQYQAIAIPPGTEHTTRVTGNGIWKGVSFYCDQCPLIQKSKPRKLSTVLTKTLDRAITTAHKRMYKQILLSPLLQETHFMELFALICTEPLAEVEFSHKGETVYYLLTGSCKISWWEKEVLLEPDMAVVMPAGFIHRFSMEDEDGCTILAGSCSSCSLSNFQAE